MTTKALLIFVADDDSEDCILLQEALEEIDLTIRFVGFDNGVTLMDSLLNKDEELPAAIFLDLNMPLMNGEECLEDIRAEKRLEDIPIVIYSTYVDELVTESLRGKGADLYLVKPTTFKDLKGTLQICIEYINTKTKVGRLRYDFLVGIG